MKIALDFDDVRKQGGQIGLSNRIDDCYRRLGTVQPSLLRQAAAYCVTLGIVGYQMDAGFRKLFKDKYAREIPPVPFYEGNTFTARVNKYARELTVDHSIPDFKSVSVFADKVGADVVTLLPGK